MEERRAKSRSKKACKKRLEELFQPTEEKLENGEFDVEGGSDAFDEAINSVKEAYFATPDLGRMIKDQWDIFLKENTDHPVEMIDLDELDDVDQPTDQVPHLNDQVPQGNEVAGARSGIVQTPSGDSEDELLKSIPDPDVRAKIAKKFKDANMAKKRETSRVACKTRLHEISEPIKQKADQKSYDGIEGHTLYQMDQAEARKAYQNTPDLGLMKAGALDDYNQGEIHSERLIEQMDAHAQGRATENQDKMLKLLAGVVDQFKAFREVYPEWLKTRSDNFNWLKLKADSLDEEQNKANRNVRFGAAVTATSSVAGIVIVSLVLAPVTFGGSLALGLGLVSAGVGVEAGHYNFKTHSQQREYELNNHVKALTRLKTDKEQTDKIMSIIKKLFEAAKEIQTYLQPRDYNGIHNEDIWTLNYDDDRAKENVSKARLWIGAAAVVGDDLASVGLRIGLQITDDVVAAAKIAADASMALGGIAVCFGVVSLAIDTYTLVQTIKDMKDGSKSKLATSFREMAGKLGQQVTDVVSASEGIEEMVIEAEDVLTPLLKKYPLTIGRYDNE